MFFFFSELQEVPVTNVCSAVPQIARKESDWRRWNRRTPATGKDKEYSCRKEALTFTVSTFCDSTLLLGGEDEPLRAWARFEGPGLPQRRQTRRDLQRG